MALKDSASSLQGWGSGLHPGKLSKRRGPRRPGSKRLPSLGRAGSVLGGVAGGLPSCALGSGCGLFCLHLATRPRGCPAEYGLPYGLSIRAFLGFRQRTFILVLRKRIRLTPRLPVHSEGWDDALQLANCNFQQGGEEAVKQTFKTKNRVSCCPTVKIISLSRCRIHAVGEEEVVVWLCR